MRVDLRSVVGEGDFLPEGVGLVNHSVQLVVGVVYELGLLGVRNGQYPVLLVIGIGGLATVEVGNFGQVAVCVISVGDGPARGVGYALYLPLGVIGEGGGLGAGVGDGQHPALFVPGDVQRIPVLIDYPDNQAGCIEKLAAPLLVGDCPGAVTLVDKRGVVLVLGGVGAVPVVHVAVVVALRADQEHVALYVLGHVGLEPGRVGVAPAVAQGSVGLAAQ